MKTVNLFLGILGLSFMSCVAQPKTDAVDKGTTKIENGKVILSNPDLEYEVIIMDNGFERWFNTNRMPKGHYSIDFLENKNRSWVQQWNAKALQPHSGIDYSIDYNNQTHYGYEVNYMLYHYLLYYQQMNKIKLN